MEFREVETEEEVAAFIADYGILHDANINEFCMAAKNRELPDERAIDTANARLLLEFMWPRHIVLDLVFVEMVEIQFLDPGLGGSLSITTVDMIDGMTGPYFVVEMGSNTFTCRRLLYRERSEASSLRPATVIQTIPIDAIDVARTDDWAVCPRCLDGWQADAIPEYVSCPNCGQVCRLRAEP